VRFLERGGPAAIEAALRSAAVVVDGLLGTGTSSSPALRGAARDLVATAIPLVEEHGIPVVAVDLPSGIHSDDGSVPDPTVLTADVTVTFGAVKAGLLLDPGASRAGRIELVDLGLGAELDAMTPLVTTDGA
jgi:NAD(P)H-hydrate epimerase